MALAPQRQEFIVPTTRQMGWRLRELLRDGRTKGKELAEALEVSESKVSRLLKGEAWEPPYVMAICNFLAGRGRLSPSAWLLADYLTCQVSEDHPPLRLSPVGPDGGATTQHRDTGTEPTVEPYPHAA